MQEILAGGRTPAQPVFLKTLGTGLKAAWQDFNICHYHALAGRLPGLIGAASASRDHAKEVAERTGGLLADRWLVTEPRRRVAQH
ncbi:MAG: hypothetical protein ACRDNF_23625 [Streptosporangiaceae bacterium]